MSSDRDANRSMTCSEQARVEHINTAQRNLVLNMACHLLSGSAKGTRSPIRAVCAHFPLRIGDRELTASEFWQPSVPTWPCPRGVGPPAPAYAAMAGERAAVYQLQCTPRAIFSQPFSRRSLP